MPRATNREIEIKLPVTDVLNLVRRLRSLGAVPRGRVLEQNTLYDTPDSDLRWAGRLLRLRVETPARSAVFPAGSRRFIITSKARAERKTSEKPKYKERLERERVASQARDWPTVFRSIGFHPGFRYEKLRTAFRLPGLHLGLDETPVGTFLELEGRGKLIDRVARRLGFLRRDYIRGPYWGVYVADCRRRGIPPKNKVFARKKMRNQHSLLDKNSVCIY